MASWRMPNFGSSAISTSAIRLLLVASHPGNSIPAALRIEAPSAIAPHEILRPQRLAVRQPDIDPRVVLREARHLTRNGCAPAAQRPTRP